jgi:hypothetical protein
MADPEGDQEPDLGPVIAARIDHWRRAFDIPLSTMRALRAQGKGRLIFCLREEWCVWLELMAKNGGTGPLSPPAGRCRAAALRRKAP